MTGPGGEDRLDRLDRGPTALCLRCDRRWPAGDLYLDGTCLDCVQEPAEPVRNHGFAAGRAGCGCTVCIDGLRCARDAVESRMAGQTLEQIGARWGITPERARQLSVLAAPHQPWRAVRAELDAHATDQAVAAAAARPPCFVCGGPLPPPRRSRCSARCARVHTALRYHIDGDARQAAARATALWVLDTTTDPRARTNAGTILDRGLSETRRWFIPGSDAHTAAVVAVANGWPIADLLPATLRDSVVGHDSGDGRAAA